MRSSQEKCQGGISDSRREKEKENQETKRAVNNKRFHLQVSEEDVGEILAEVVRINLCQLGSASESTSVSLEGLVFMLD